MFEKYIQESIEQKVFDVNFFQDKTSKDLFISYFLSVKNLVKTVDYSLVKKTIDLMDDINKYITQATTFRRTLKPYASSSRLDKEISEYSFVHYKTRYLHYEGFDSFYADYVDEEKNEAYPVYLDAPISFGVKKKKQPLFVTSAFPCDSHTLLTHQFQGLNPLKLPYDEESSKKAYLKDGFYILGTKPNHHLNLFRWKDLSIDIISSFGKKHGFSKIGILGAENNLWAHPEDSIDRVLDPERAKVIYDNYALSRGFTYNSDGNLYKEIR